jgi:hypothetical protein
MAPGPSSDWSLREKGERCMPVGLIERGPAEAFSLSLPVARRVRGG